MKIVVDLIQADGSPYCVNCEHSSGPFVDGFGGCSLFRKKWKAIQVTTNFDPVMLRHPLCIAGEREYHQTIGAKEREAAARREG